MRFTLKDYQEEAVRMVLQSLEDARDDYRSKNRKIAFALSAITGAGKTVMAAAVFEALFEGSDDYEVDADPTAVVLWVTDDPNLNEQTRYRIMEASDKLTATRLKIINESFDLEKLDASKVYFLNRQKLTGKTFITTSNKRTFTLWDTIKNTIDDSRRTLYLVLDEAHRGVKTSGNGEEKDRSTTILRLINGHNGIPAAPIVLGISATVERFTTAMAGSQDRTLLPNVEVDNARVQESGLLKDTIVLDLPAETGAFTTVLAREAANSARNISEVWAAYSQKEGIAEPVVPLLVVQVPNTPTKTDIVALLDAIYSAWPELPENSVANVFGEHAHEVYGKWQVPYVAPQDIQDATHIRVLLAKDAISTGWDCPRAETLMSLRPANDRTHITQLMGRMVRTPLARRVDSDERLNAVTCFLPHFDLRTARDVADIMTGVKHEPNGPPPTRTGRVLIEPVELHWNENLLDDVRQCFAELPSKAAPKTPAKPIKRLLSLAAELAIDGLVTDPNKQAHETLYAVMDGQRAQHAKKLEGNVADILTADIRRLTASRLDQTATETTRELEADDQTVDDAFRVAVRAFGSAVANGYAKNLALAEAEDDEDFDIFNAKARIAALVQIPGVVEIVEAAAEALVKKWLAAHRAKIKNLNEERQAAYDTIRLQAKDPQEIDVIVPVSRIENTWALDGDKKTPLPTRQKHLLVDDDGNFPVEKLGDWEATVLDTELGREDTLAWYRNPSTVSKHAIQVPWYDGQRWRSMQADFIFFTKLADGTTGASIVDPHGHHLQDALGKLKGLADFAEEYSDDFVRIDAISKNDKGDLGGDTKGALLLLDLLDKDVRKVVRASVSAAEAYKDAGVRYE
jgi:type III restriction enzyme